MEKYRKLIAKAKEPLTDAQYLDQYINDIHQFRSHEILGMKDANSMHLMMTPVSAKIHGFKNIDEVIETTDYQSHCKAIAKVADTLCNQDRQVKETRSIKTILDIHEFATGLFTFKTTKSPVINPLTNNILGILWHSSNLEIDVPLKTILDIHGVRFGRYSSIDIANNPGKFELTDIERHVLFCVCLGISHRKDVANFLTVVYKHIINAETTIHDAFRRLYRKLNCNTPMQLLEFAVYNDLHLQIPQVFLPNGSYIMR